MPTINNINNDAGHLEAENLILQIEQEMHREYKQATEEIQEKLNDYLKQFTEKDERQKKLLAEGKITEDEYKQWRERKMLIGKRWEQMLEVISQDAVHTDIIAMSIVKGHMPEAYAIGHNYGTYLIESGVGIDTSYTLYDRQTIERLWRENPKLLPDPLPGSTTFQKLEENERLWERIKNNDPTLTEAERQKYVKDMRWNRNHIQSAITQGILQGEPLDKVALRLIQVTNMDERAAQRSAATMITSAHNGGRIASYKRAESMGIKNKKTWLATLDGHTRVSHRHLDGQTVPNDDPFKSDLGDIMFPGDPSALPANVWNCRCTLITKIEGFEIDPTDLELREHKALKNMTYQQWKDAKGTEPLFQAAQNRTQDKAQFEAYQKILGKKNMPKNLDEFQRLKYETPEKWEELKKRAREARKTKNDSNS